MANCTESDSSRVKKLVMLALNGLCRMTYEKVRLYRDSKDHVDDRTSLNTMSDIDEICRLLGSKSGVTVDPMLAIPADPTFRDGFLR